MSGLMRCKACGYVMAAEKIKDLCPACGLPKTVFEAYEERISPGRKFILGLDLHPISVHFPQALTVLSALFIAGSLLLRAPLSADLLSASRLLIILLPFAVLGAFAAGLVDGRARFRRLRTPRLTQKMIVGSVLLVLSVIMFVLVLRSALETSAIHIVLVLTVGCLACEVLLGKIGVRLICTRVRG